MEIKLIDNFNDSLFQNAFIKYFNELGISISDWNGLFNQMNKDSGNYAYIIFDNNAAIGFIQFKAISLCNSFFNEEYGFIRELWIDEHYRNNGYGTALLNLAEEFFLSNGMYQTILTTNTASAFYIKNGYVKNNRISAKNNDCVFTKNLNHLI